MFFYFFVIPIFYSYESHYNRVDIFLTLQKINLQTYFEISLYLHNVQNMTSIYSDIPVGVLIQHNELYVPWLIECYWDVTGLVINRSF